MTKISPASQAFKWRWHNVGTPFRFFTAADINGDGSLDLVTANVVSNSLTVFTNNGSGVFSYNATIQAEDPSYVVAADVNGDGSLDLIAASNGGQNTECQLTVLTNNGFGVFGSNATVSLRLIVNWLVAADVNGDGKPDLITANNLNTLTILTNNGSGIFGSNATYNVGILPQAPVWVVAADINGDGKPDLISANYMTDTITVLTNNGNGIFGLNTNLQVGLNPTCVAAADLTGDGKLDLIVANSANERPIPSTLSVFINTSTFPTPTTTPTLHINNSGKEMSVSWPSVSAGWSLQQNPDLTTASWLRSGYNGYGICIFVMGLILRLYSIFYLGRFFTINVAIATDHRLIDSGPYRFIRHPSYTGSLMLFFGLGLGIGNWVSVVIMIGPTFAVLFWRMNIEEAALIESLGEPYRSYMKRTKRLMPMIY